MNKCPNWNDRSNQMLLNSMAEAYGHAKFNQFDFELLKTDKELFRADNKSRMEPVYHFYNLFSSLDEMGQEWLEEGVERVVSEKALEDLKADAKQTEKFIKTSTEYRTGPNRRKIQYRLEKETLENYRNEWESNGLPIHSFDKAQSNKVLVSLTEHLRFLNPTLNIEFVKGGLKNGAKAMMEGNTYTLDIDKASPVDLLHEHGHLLMAGLKSSDPLYYSQLVDAALQHPIVNEFRAKYPELTEEQLGEEVFVELLAEKASDMFTSSWWDSHNKIYNEAVDKAVKKIPFDFTRPQFERSLNDTLAKTIEEFAPKLLKESVTDRKKQIHEYMLEELGIDPNNLSSEMIRLLKYHQSRRICQ